MIEENRNYYWYTSYMNTRDRADIDDSGAELRRAPAIIVLVVNVYHTCTGFLRGNVDDLAGSTAVFKLQMGWQCRRHR